MIGTKREQRDQPQGNGEKPAPMLIGFRRVYVFDRLSRDLWPSLYAPGVTRGAG
jgi:hypothetical protein